MLLSSFVLACNVIHVMHDFDRAQKSLVVDFPYRLGILSTQKANFSTTPTGSTFLRDLKKDITYGYDTTIWKLFPLTPLLDFYGTDIIHHYRTLVEILGGIL